MTIIRLCHLYPINNQHGNKFNPLICSRNFLSEKNLIFSPLRIHGWVEWSLVTRMEKETDHFLTRCNNMTGNRMRLVNVAVTRVSEVNQPNAWVPPKLLKQKMMKPAISTRDV